MTHQVPQFTVSPTPLPGYEQAGGEMMDTESAKDRLIRESTVAFINGAGKITSGNSFSRYLGIIRDHADEVYKPKG